MRNDPISAYVYFKLCVLDDRNSDADFFLYNAYRILLYPRQCFQNLKNSLYTVFRNCTESVKSCKERSTYTVCVSIRTISIFGIGSHNTLAKEQINHFNSLKTVA